MQASYLQPIIKKIHGNMGPNISNDESNRNTLFSFSEIFQWTCHFPLGFAGNIGTLFFSIKITVSRRRKKEANNTQGSTLKVGIQRPSESMTGQKPRSKILHIYLTWQIGHESREKLQYGLEGIYWLLISREVVRLLFLCLWEEKAAVLWTKRSQRRLNHTGKVIVGRILTFYRKTFPVF